MQSVAVAAWIVLLPLFSGAGYAQTPARQEPPVSPPASSQKDRTLAKAISDSWITMKVHAQFIPEDALDNSNIDVDTRAGVVTLSGTVATDAGRKRAVEIARSADGVKSVNDAALRVVPTTVGTTGPATAGKRIGRSVNDGWIKSKVYSRFLTEEALNDSDIDVDVSSGVVSLSGTVRSETGRARAEAIAKATDGVKSVTNAVKVTAP
ncbi:MAG TPA: BON domain-containing protein [Vicinamibacterales bacterium]|nr:BON domain-containing protein [Vicinamibacterales bacterium]